MTENTKLWDLLGRTDPAHTKGFTRGGGFKGTAIKPMWSYRRMTEEFGPCGQGWGIDAPQFQVLAGAEDEKLVFCTATVWYLHEGERRLLIGVGGDKAVAKNKFGLSSDDEAFKKSFTDAVTNALKMLGVGADVHMGKFDDSKYVNTMREEFADEVAAEQPAKSSAALKRDDAWNKLMFQLSVDFGDCKSLVTLSKLRAEYREKAKTEGWTRAWLEELKNEFDTFEESLLKQEPYPGAHQSPNGKHLSTLQAGE